MKLKEVSWLVFVTAGFSRPRSGNRPPTDKRENAVLFSSNKKRKKTLSEKASINLI